MTPSQGDVVYATVGQNLSLFAQAQANHDKYVWLNQLMFAAPALTTLLLPNHFLFLVLCLRFVKHSRVPDEQPPERDQSVRR